MSAAQSFFKSLLDHDPSIQELARKAQKLLEKASPKAVQEYQPAWGGYLLFKTTSEGGNSVIFLSAHKKHVSLGFAEGAKLEDPHQLLQGSGKLQRHVKLKKLDDLKLPGLEELLDQAWSRQPDSKVVEESLARLRDLCLAFPDSNEVISHGHPTFKLGKKTFAVYGIYSPSVAIKADVQLLAEIEGEERFFPTPYMAHKGWISLRIDEKTDWDEVTDVVERSFLQMANKKQKSAWKA